MKLPPFPVFYIATALSLVVVGDGLIYTILPSYYQHLGLVPFQVGILLSVNRWIRLATNHLAEHCYRRYPSNAWLIFALFIGSVVTVIYGIAHLFIVFLGARILWGLSYSFIRQAGIMTAIKSGSSAHLGERMGYFRGINAMWHTLGVLVGGLCHDAFGFTPTLIALSLLSLIAMPLGALSQKGVKRLQVPVEKDLSGKGDVGVICCGFAVGLVGAGMIMSTLGFILKEHFEDAVVIAGHAIGVVTLTGIILGLRFFLDGIGNPILGFIADRTGRERSIMCLFSVGATSLFISGMNLKPIILVIFVLIFFACGTTLWTLLSSQAGQRGPRSVASFATAWDLGASVGPLMGWSIAHFGFPTHYIFLSAGTIFMFGAVISFKTFGTKKPDQQAPQTLQ